MQNGRDAFIYILVFKFVYILDYKFVYVTRGIVRVYPGPAMPVRITDQDRQRFARLKADELSAFYERVAEGRDAPLLRAAYVLFLEVFEAELTGERYNKGQAFRFIPFKHPATCNKVLEDAKANGFIVLEKDRTDTRQRWVVPTRKLMELVATGLDDAIEATARVLAGRDTKGARRKPPAKRRPTKKE